MPHTTTTPSSTAGSFGEARLDCPVRACMTPGVVCLVEDASLRQAERAMTAHGVHALLVVGRLNGRPMGWLTARGLLERLSSQDDLDRAGRAVSEHALRIDPSSTARDALTLMLEERVPRLLVSHGPDALPEGVITEVDLLRLVTT